MLRCFGCIMWNRIITSFQARLHFRKRKLEGRIKKKWLKRLIVIRWIIPRTFIITLSKNHSMYIRFVMDKMFLVFWYSFWTKNHFYPCFNEERRIFVLGRTSCTKITMKKLNILIDHTPSVCIKKDTQILRSSRFDSSAIRKRLCRGKIHIWWNTHFYPSILNNYNIRIIISNEKYPNSVFSIPPSIADFDFTKW